jgi:UDP-N-acetylmuramyl tripeptide synthase
MVFGIYCDHQSNWIVIVNCYDNQPNRLVIVYDDDDDDDDNTDTNNYIIAAIRFKISVVLVP